MHFRYNTISYQIYLESGIEHSLGTRVEDNVSELDSDFLPDQAKVNEL